MERRRTKASTRLAVVAGVLAGLVSAAGLTQAPQSGTWELLGPLLETRSGATATLLQSGQALVVGGRNRRRVLTSVEAFDPASGSTPIASLHVARAYHTATRLLDGRVLVTGGASTNGITTATAELFDPIAGTWTLLKMNAARAHHTATLLEDGRVLVAGGEADGIPIPLLEVFDPSDESFSLLSGLLSTARTRHAAVLLPTGVVSVAGGSDGTNALATSEVIHSSVGWVMAGPAMSTARANFTATDLLNGDVLIAGGTDGKQELASVERFNHETGVFELLLGGG